MSPLQRLRQRAVTHSLFTPTTLQRAIDRLGFVQADPIRAPARAQDLILRHRVETYRAGDLERLYPSLDVEEDVLYAYGFLSRGVWALIHPRKKKRFSMLERKVLDVVSRMGPMHPRDLEPHFGRNRVINAWGSYSKATTHALDQLQYYGMLRISRRDNGIRVYEAVRPALELEQPDERLAKLVLIVAHVLSPVQKKTLRSIVARYRHMGNVQQVLRELLRSGQLVEESIDGVPYMWTAAVGSGVEDLSRVRFLAPFDPLVWDRRRFEHLWQWSYRFEAYTPPAKRVRGYYAMPLLWRDRILGWANASIVGGGLQVDVGFVDGRPKERDFRTQLEAEIARLEMFLDLSAPFPYALSNNGAQV